MVSLEMSVAEVIVAHEPRRTGRVGRTVGEAPGPVPDPATKGCRTMWTRMSSVVLVTGATLLGLALGTSEATHGGDGSRPDAVFYELTEEAVFTPDGFRDATSSLEGKARQGSALCPHGLQAHAKRFFPPTVAVKTTPRCRVVALGRSVIDVNPESPEFGSGKISGSFWVVVNSVATNLTDAAELVVMAGTFAGQVQVTDAAGRLIEVLPGSMFTPVMTLPGFPKPPSASFTGTFRLPFTVHHVAVYLGEHGRLVPVLPDERALGDPTVRLEVDFD
jgi:hypothetical protein